MSFNRKPPWKPSSPSAENTQCASGKYTSVNQMGANTSQAVNFIRPAAPEATMAMVMAANRMNQAAKYTPWVVPLPSSAWKPCRPR